MNKWFKNSYDRRVQQFEHWMTLLESKEYHRHEKRKTLIKPQPLFWKKNRH